MWYMISFYFQFILTIQHEVIGIFQLNKMRLVRYVDCMNMHLLNDFFWKDQRWIFIHICNLIFLFCWKKMKWVLVDWFLIAQKTTSLILNERGAQIREIVCCLIYNVFLIRCNYSFRLNDFLIHIISSNQKVIRWKP